MKDNRKDVSLKKTAAILDSELQFSAVIEYPLEALKVLSTSILREVEALKKAINSVPQGKIDLNEELQRYEKHLIRSALLRTGGNQRQAARLLNVKFTTLNIKIKRFGITLNGLYQENEQKNDMKPQI